MKNKLSSLETCPVTATMEVIGGKWKLLIIHLIENDINRFGKMCMLLRGVSRQMLTTQLRDLEKHDIIRREIYPEIPPRVEYFLTDKGKKLIPVLNEMAKFGLEFNLSPELKEQRLIKIGQDD